MVGAVWCHFFCHRAGLQKFHLDVSFLLFHVTWLTDQSHFTMKTSDSKCLTAAAADVAMLHLMDPCCLLCFAGVFYSFLYLQITSLTADNVVSHIFPNV